MTVQFYDKDNQDLGKMFRTLQSPSIMSYMYSVCNTLYMSCRPPYSYLLHAEIRSNATFRLTINVRFMHVGSILRFFFQSINKIANCCSNSLSPSLITLEIAPRTRLLLTPLLRPLLRLMHTLQTAPQIAPPNSYPK